MAHTAQTWQELIPDLFCPHVAVMCTRDAEAVCQKNNLAFVEMMRPFCQLTTEAQVRDAHNQPHMVKNLRLRFSEPSSEVPSMGVTKQTMHNIVLRAQPGGAIVPGSTLQVGNLSLNVLTPWFEAYREQYFQLLRVSDHEYIRHYVGCLFVVSTSHTRPMDAFVELQRRQQEMAKDRTYPKWLSPYVFYYFLLVHDVSRGEEDNAQSIFQSMKATFGQHSSHLLKINSRSPDASLPGGMPDPWGQYLNRPEQGLAVGEDGSDDDEGAEEPAPAEGANGPGPADSASASATLVSIAADDAPTDPLQVAGDPLQVTETAAQEKAAWQDPLLSPQNTSRGDKKSTVGLDVPRKISQTSSLRNSASGSNGMHGQYLTVSDHDRLRIFVHEMAVRGLIPHIERSIRALTDQVNSKKGIQRTLYSATRKWFSGSNKPVIMQGQNYSSDAAELQSRKLADLAFLVQLYDTAFNWYHTAKRDFHNDNAMLHYAGAVELAATSLFMQGAYRRDPQAYFEESVTTYDTVCKSQQFALRATLLFFEYLKFKGLYKEAALALIRMTSEETDLAAALLTEQAAICYLRLPTPMIRKYAMHMLLAGHRFKKAYQRQHALRAYSLALQVYQMKGWWVAEDHMNYIVGRLAVDLHELGLAHESFHQLLSHKTRLVAPHQQSLYLQEFLLAMKKFLAKSDRAAMEKSQSSSSSCIDIASHLPLTRFPKVDAQQTRVILPGVADSTKLLSSEEQEVVEDDAPVHPSSGSKHPVTGDDEGQREELWLCMEELAARFSIAATDSSARNGSLGAGPPGFVWDVRLFGPNTPNAQHPRCAMGERVMVELVLINELQVPLMLTNVSLMWQLFPVALTEVAGAAETPAAVAHEGEESVVCNTVPELTLAPSSSQPVCLSLTPQHEGKLHILGIVYTLTEMSPPPQKEGTGRARSGTQRLSLADGLRCRQEIEPRGPRLNQTKDHRCSVMYGPDKRLQLSVYPPMPLLKLCFEGFPSVLLCGEVRHCVVKLTNVGRVALHRLRAVCPESQQIVWGDVQNRVPSRSGVYSTVGQSTPANASSTSESCRLRDKVWPCFPLSASSAFTGSSPLADDSSRARVCVMDLPDDRLEPGSTIEVDCWVRGSALPGVQSIDTLMYFDVAGETALSHRVLRHTSHIHVTESIRIAARTRRSVALSSREHDLDQVLVSVDIENLSQGEAATSPQFSIKQIVGISDMLTLSPLQEEGAINLSSRETAYIHLKASHKNADSNHVHISNISFSPDQDMVDSLVIPCMELFGQDEVAHAFAAAEPDCAGANKQDASRSSSATPIAAAASSHPATPGCVATPLGVIVLWEAKVRDGAGRERVAHGQYHMLVESLETPVSSATAHSSLVSFSARAGMEGSSDAHSAGPDELLVKASVRHLDRMQNDFSKKRLLTVPVELILHNSHDTSVEIEVAPVAAAGTASELDKSSHMKTNSCGSTSFSWIGCVHRKVRVASGQARTIKLRASFSRPAVYNLSSLKLLVRKTADGQALEQRPLAPSLLVLEDHSAGSLA